MLEAQSSRGSLQESKPFARFRNVAVAVVLLILVGASVYSVVKLSSVQASLSKAQQQISAEKSQVSAEQQQLSADEQKISTLQSTVDSQLVNSLSSFAKYGDVCSETNVPFSGRLETAYFPCTDQNPARTSRRQ